MNEELLNFAWKYGLYKISASHDTENTNIQILDPGTQNNHAGPDFIGARIKEGETVWIGNVESHLRSSDWYKHAHHVDPAYNNVILQIVFVHDKQVYTENGRLIPVFELKVDKGLAEKYEEFKQNSWFIPCANHIQKIEQFKLSIWLSKVLVERLAEKASFIEGKLSENKGDWEETFYQLMARSFGFNVNAEPFEWLAKSIPLQILARHHHSLKQTESLIFGQAGFLDKEPEEKGYYSDLRDEYLFLKSKYQLKPLDMYLWKFLRIRPANFPTIRLAQYSQVIFKSNALFSKVLEAQTPEELMSLLKVGTSEYWQQHYHFHKTSGNKKKLLGKQAIDNIIINTIVPVLFIYGRNTGNDEAKEKALSFLEKIKPEKNGILENWKKVGVTFQSAFYSQALIQQYKYYCSYKRCLECGIGIEIFKKFGKDQH